MGKETATETFATIADVLDYLLAAGWKVTRASLYRHHKEGKLLPQADGSFARAAVDKYAKTWLKEAATGKKVREKVDARQTEKLEKEMRLLDIEIRRKERADAKEADKLISVGEVELYRALSMQALKDSLRKVVLVDLPEWIRVVGGDINKIGDLKSHVENKFDELLVNYAFPGKYEAIIPPVSEELAEEEA